MGQETGTNTNNQLTTNNDVTKIFLGDNLHESYQFEYDNTSGGVDVTFPAGTLFGRISATGYVTPLTSGASDGSQIPKGILREDITIVYGEIFDGYVTLCEQGKVAKEQVIFQGSDDFDTEVSSRRLDDRIGSDTVGIKLVSTTEMTAFDND